MEYLISAKTDETFYVKGIGFNSTVVFWTRDKADAKIYQDIDYANLTARTLRSTGTKTAIVITA